MGLQDKETDGHRGIGLLEHIVFSRKELVQGDEIPQRFAHFLSLDSDHIVVHPIFHGFVSVGSRTLGNLTFVVGKILDMVMSIRTEAKQKKDWATSDKIRDELKAAGVAIKDTKEGYEWELVEN